MQLIGHRGARGEAPENTLGGFAHIIDLGLKAVEFDVRLLQDNQLAVIHDDNFLRTANLNQQVQHTHSNELVHTDNREGWSTWQHAEPTPTLAQTLHVIQHFEHIEVEVKAVDSLVEADMVVQQLHHDLADYQQSATITSFDLKVLQVLQQCNSPFKRGLLIELPLGEAVVDIAQQYGCTRIGLKDALTTPALILRAQQAHLQISVWTVNDIERAKYLATLGVDGLITDVPSQMIAANIAHCHL